MFTRFLAAISIVILALPLVANAQTTGPVIDGYGAAFVVEDRDVPLIPDHVYRVVYEITAYGNAPDGVNAELDRVARFLNLHGKNGAALVNMLNDAAYQQRFEIKNPNLELLQKLSDAGVKLYVCGQSMAGRGFAKAELARGVQLALSAMTMVHQLQDQGYTLQP
jgi:intracellular sulfur oxidation DsrE/DsrF family protein